MYEWNFDNHIKIMIITITVIMNYICIVYMHGLVNLSKYDVTQTLHTSSPPHCDGSSKINGSIPQMIPCYQNSLGIRLVKSMTGSSTMDTYWVVAIRDVSPCSTILSLSMDPFITLEDCTLICWYVCK